jgi:hypothetical protein
MAEQDCRSQVAQQISLPVIYPFAGMTVCGR